MDGRGCSLRETRSTTCSSFHHPHVARSGAGQSCGPATSATHSDTPRAGVAPIARSRWCPEWAGPRRPRIVKRVPTPIGSTSGRHSRTPGSISGAVSGELTAAKTTSGVLGITVVLSTTVVLSAIGRRSLHVGLRDRVELGELGPDPERPLRVVQLRPQRRDLGGFAMVQSMQCPGCLQPVDVTRPPDVGVSIDRDRPEGGRSVVVIRMGCATVLVLEPLP